MGRGTQGWGSAACFGAGALLTGTCCKSHGPGCDLCSPPAMKKEATTPGQEPAASPVVPSPSGLPQAMLVWRLEDEGRIIKAIITGGLWAPWSH